MFEVELLFTVHVWDILACHSLRSSQNYLYSKFEAVLCSPKCLFGFALSRYFLGLTKLSLSISLVHSIAESIQKDCVQIDQSETPTKP